ncbi:hypothetical protein [Nostoc sp. DedSLP04]|uniref:hypothetical protein n=1 Tax=Nostoc sp. DedSLP04 TaxID=3075401 RepID=UPI002AD388BF|nr:hypothetical protein [Nostoc sp. DedSLP04]MDZ8031972.1 hypothetical protein [Nostoc sp. DedSLP04]
MTNTILNLQTATEHEVLAVVGKKYLRSGRRITTDKLSQWANFQPGGLSVFLLQFIIPKYYKLMFLS